MADTAEVVIAGAGIIGLFSALQLAKRGVGRIVVLEKGRSFGEGSTGASSAVCRTRYSTDKTVVLARDGIAVYRDWRNFLELPDPVARFHSTGVLWLGNGELDLYEAEAQRMRSLGVATELIDDAGLEERYPAINPCPIPPDFIDGEPHDCVDGGQHMVESSGGHMDPMDTLQDLLGAVRERGVEVRFDAEITGIDRAGGRVSGVRTVKGDIHVPVVVNAAGPWCDRINAMAGLDSPWPLRPTRIQIVHLDRPASVKGTLPACADPFAGFYFRTQNRGQQIIVGSVLEEEEREIVDPDDFNRSVDDDFARVKIYGLQHRLRGLDQIRGVAGYSGLYTINRADVHPVVGATPVQGFFVANGFSGHGFKLAPSIGAMVARSIAGGHLEGETQVDSDFLAFDRTPIAIKSLSVLA